MMNKYIWIMLLACLSPVFSQETRKCATHLLESQNRSNYAKVKKDFENSLQKIIQARKKLRATDYEIVTIPVVVHVMHPNLNLGQAQNVSDAIIQSQIEVLNLDFRKLNKDTLKTLEAFKNVAADSKIQFCLAKTSPDCLPTTGIVRVPTAKAVYNVFDLEPMKSLSYWPSDQYLNIWITDLEDGYVGYSTFPYGANMPGVQDDSENEDPRFDGVVIDYRSFGVGNHLKTGFKYGRTTTHEVGHWLGLRHPWGDEYCGTDFCDDTPTQDSGTSGCNRRTSCDNINPSMMENFMDYTYDECMSVFSKDQVDRMRAAIVQSARRRILIENNLCAKTSLDLYRPDFEGFETSDLAPYLNLKTQAARASIGAWEASNASMHFLLNAPAVLIYTPILALKEPKNINYFNFDIAVLNKGNAMPKGNLVLNYTLGCSNAPILISKTPLAQLIANSNQQALPSKSDWHTLSYNIGALHKDYLNLEISYEGDSVDVVDIYLDNLLFSENKQNILDINFDYTLQELVFKPRHLGTKDLEVEIYNVEGTLIYKNEFPQISSTTIALDKLSNPLGIYIVKVSYDGKPQTYKFANLRK